MLDTFLLDPNLMDDQTSDTSAAITINRRKFRDDVIMRDGTCVMNGSNGVQACHIIPHAKGHQVCTEYLLNHTVVLIPGNLQYIINLANHRHEAFDPPLDNINDVRNGILLVRQIHTPFGNSQVAFLQVCL